MTRFLLFCFAFVHFSCANTNRPNRTINQNEEPGAVETRLGQSNYFILLPATFSLSEARGKEGQLGYNIIPRDTGSTMFGFIEIRHGHPIGGDSIHDGPPKETVSSNFLNKQVQWNVYVTEAGNFSAYTNEKGDLNAWASSKKRNGIDSLIAIISTLKQK